MFPWSTIGEPKLLVHGLYSCSPPSFQKPAANINARVTYRLGHVSENTQYITKYNFITRRDQTFPFVDVSPRNVEYDNDHCKVLSDESFPISQE